MSTRRQLIKGGIAGLFSAGAASVMATPKDQPQQFDEVYDLVIIGAGGAGLSAGGHAAEDGMKVLILEKNELPGRILRYQRRTVGSRRNAFPES